MKVCPNCKEKTSDGMLYCPMCGTNIQNVQPIHYKQDVSLSDFLGCFLTVCKIIGIILVIAFVIFCFRVLKQVNYVEAIKNDSPNGYSMSYGTMFNKELDNVEWDYDSSSKEVIVTGDSDNVPCKFVFAVKDTGKGEFSYNLKSAAVGPVPVKDSLASLVVIGMFDDASKSK